MDCFSQIVQQQAHQKRRRNDDVAVERQGLLEVAVKECGEGPRAPAGGAGGEMKEVPPQTKVRPPRQGFGRDYRQNCYGERQSEQSRIAL